MTNPFPRPSPTFPITANYLQSTFPEPYLFDDSIAEQEVEGGQPSDRQCPEAGHALPRQLLQVLGKKHSEVMVPTQAYAGVIQGGGELVPPAR